MNETFCILIRISLKHVPKGPIDNNPALVRIMSWCRTGNKPWSNADTVHWHIYTAFGGDEFLSEYFFNTIWVVHFINITDCALIWCWISTNYVNKALIKCSFHAYFNILRPRQNGRHFPYDIFKCIFVNGNVWISIRISMKFVPKGPINNIPALVQIMAWRRPGDKPSSEPVMISLLAHICVTRPQSIK